VINVRTLSVEVSLSLLFGCSNDSEAPGAKSENSALLAIWLRHKSEPIRNLEFADLEEYHFVCIPSHGHRIWVLLNARYTPFYKQTPWNENFSISEADYKRIEDKKVATEIVLQVLGSHLSDGTEPLRAIALS
jgi:hypothetical protein